MEIELRGLIDALPGLVWTTTPDGYVDFINQRWREYAALTIDEVRADGWKSAIHPDDLPRAQARWDALVAAGEAGEVEVRLRRFDGEYRRFSIKTCPLTDASGRLVGWCGINTEIEDRMQAEEAAHEHRRRYQQIVDGLPGIVALFTPEGRITFCNRQMLEYLDETLEDVQAKASAYNFHPDDRDAVLGEWAACVRSGRPFFAEARLERADGVFRWHRTRVYPLRDAAGDIELWYGLSIDIEETKHAEAELATDKAELRRAYDLLAEAQRLSQTGSFTWDVAANEHNWSDETYRIMGLDPGTTVTSATVLRAIHPEDLPSAEAVMARAAEGEGFDLAFRVVAGGAVRHIHAVGHRIARITDRLVFIGAIQDVTDSKVGEDALTRARAELAHVARAATLSALTASIAHEVNQPLAGIITNASTCLRMLAADPPNLDGARATAERTIRDGNRASEVIQRLRAMFARKQAATEAVDLNEAAREVLALSASELQSARVVQRLDFAPDLPPVLGDRVQLQQVILNLILNAADAMRAVNDRPRNLWLATARDEAGGVRLSVRDEGIGIDAQNVERLFDAFYTTKSEGMGIGLAVSRSIIQSHDGRLWGTPNGEGPGATFSFSIPLEPASAPA